MCAMTVVGVAPCQVARPVETRPRRRADFLDFAAFALNPPATRRDDKGLAERVRMPGCPGAPGSKVT